MVGDDVAPGNATGWIALIVHAENACRRRDYHDALRRCSDLESLLAGRSHPLDAHLRARIKRVREASVGSLNDGSRLPTLPEPQGHSVTAFTRAREARQSQRRSQLESLIAGSFNESAASFTAMGDWSRTTGNYAPNLRASTVELALAERPSGLTLKALTERLGEPFDMGDVLSVLRRRSDFFVEWDGRWLSRAASLRQDPRRLNWNVQTEPLPPEWRRFHNPLGAAAGWEDFAGDSTSRRSIQPRHTSG